LKGDRPVLSRQAIFQAYFHGPQAIIALIEQHLGEEVLAPPPSILALQHTVQGQLDEIDRLKRQIANLQEQLSQLRHQNFRLSRRISELEGQTTLPQKDSHNSSLPPSTDPPTCKRTRSLRRPSGRQVGGQPGHPGQTRRQVEQPDQIIYHRAQQCRRCLASLDDSQVISTQKRQLIDLPKVKLTVTEHRVEVRRCPSCGQINKGSFPKDVRAPVQYGPRLKARAVYLLEYQLLPYERTCELLRDWFGYRPSAGTVSSFVSECAGKLVRSEAQIKARLKQAPVIHVDETGLRVAKHGQYVHVTSTANLTHYSCHSKRGREAIDEISILPQYRGTCVHDGWASYRQYGQCLHSLCGAHLLRELTYLSEASQQEKQWTEPLMKLLLEMKEAASEARQSGLKQVSRKQANEFTRQYDELTEENWRSHQAMEARAGPGGETEAITGRALAVWKQSRSLLFRLRLKREEVLRFMTDLSVPFDNNQAERDLRMVKLQQKISGCFRTQAGACQFCRIRGYVSTKHKADKAILKELEAVFES